MKIKFWGAMRELYFSEEFWEFYLNLQDNIQKKFDYVISIVKEEQIISTKFVKNLVGTDFYEMRVSVGNNEYRTVLFAVDNENIILSTRIYVLNAFKKKSKQDYKKQIEKAYTILNRIR